MLMAISLWLNKKSILISVKSILILYNQNMFFLQQKNCSQNYCQVCCLKERYLKKEKRKRKRERDSKGKQKDANIKEFNHTQERSTYFEADQRLSDYYHYYNLKL